MTRFALSFSFVLMVAACAADSDGPDPDAEPDVAVQPAAVNTSAPIVSAIGDKCLDNKHNATADHNPIQLFTCNSSDAQKWLYTGGQLVSPSGACLDIASNNQVAGTTVQLFHCNQTGAQQWTVRGKAIVSTAGLCLAVAGASSADGTAIQLAKCDGSASQTWTARGIAATTGQFPTALTWDFAHEVILATGSDLWPTTWAADDTVVTGWGDGGGFGQVGTQNDASVGFAKISGMPPNISPVNEWGNASPGTSKALHQATFCGKPESMMSVGGVLYVWIGSSYNDKTTDNPRCPATPKIPTHRLARSTDGGVSWSLQALTITEGTGAFLFNNFIEYGKDNAGAPGGFVYALGVKFTNLGDDGFNTAPGNYLVRIPAGSIGTLSAYQVFTGLDTTGNAQWTKSFDTTHAARVDGTTNGLGNVFFHAATAHYISAGFTPGPGSYVLYQAPAPWGPWTKFASGNNTTAFGGNAKAEALSITFPAKWISSDGRTIWAVYSWGEHAGDAFHLLKGTLTYNAETSGAVRLIETNSGKHKCGDTVLAPGQLSLADCTGAAAQAFTFSGGALTTSTGTCLQPRSNDNLARVIAATCDRSNALQSWTVRGDELVNGGGKCLDLQKGASTNGTPINVWDCFDNANQQWSFQ